MILYLHGFGSSPASQKARYLTQRFAAAGNPIVAADLTPGEDGFERCSPSSMLAIASGLLAGAPPPHAIIGSSLGGYLAAVAASRDPSIERLVLLAPAFRLFERWSAKLTANDLAQWEAGGRAFHHSGSNRMRRLGWQFYEDAVGWPEFPVVTVPTLCIAGQRDDTVPIEDVAAFVDRTPSARLIAVDDDHSLTASLERIFEEASTFLERHP